MRFEPATCASVLGCIAVLACGTSSSEPQASLDGGPPGGKASLFSGPSIPSCAEGNSANTLIAGHLAGQPVSLSEGGPSQLDPKDYYALEASGTANNNPMLWHPLDLEWQAPLVEGQSVALTGGYLSLTPNQKYGPYYCISSGDFGPEPLSSATAVGRGFRFRITGAVQASLPDGSSNVDCSGAPVAASLSGCIYRTSTYLPANTTGSGGTPGSGGSGGTSATGGGGSSGSAPTAPDGDVQRCFGTACPNGECDNQSTAQASCSTSYTGPVTANSSYCNAGATGGYCIVVGPDAFNITTWVIDCLTGTATLEFCPTGCGTTNSSKVPTCE